MGLISELGKIFYFVNEITYSKRCYTFDLNLILRQRNKRYNF
jgi:hypothetical protein